MDKRASEFAGRRTRDPAPGSVPAQDQPAPQGTRPGDFDRNPCGGCWHWKPFPQAGINMGKCMAAPPVSVPMQQQGRPGAILTRPVVPENYEGCDLWDDQPEFEDGPGELEPAHLATGTEG